MKKFYKYEEGINRYLTKIELVPTKGINTSNMRGTYYVLKVTSQQYKNGRLVHTMENVEFPEHTGVSRTNRLHSKINLINRYGINYQYGTEKQCAMLKRHGYSDNKSILSNLMACIKVLQINDLFEDDGIEFGKQMLISDLPSDYVSFIKSL